MSMADRDGIVWHDGKLVPWHEATTHALTHSLHHGLSVFEGVRAYNTERGTAIFQLGDHTNRLVNSAHIYQIPMPYDHATINDAQCAVLRANALESCYGRPRVLSGSEKVGVSPKGATVHVAIGAWPWGAYLGEQALTARIRVKMSFYTRRHVDVTKPRVNIATTYAHSIPANTKAVTDRCDEAFFTGTAAEITPIRDVNNRQIRKDRRGTITEKLQTAFFDLVNGRNPKYLHWLTPV